MIVVLAGCAAGLLLDARAITGAQAWRGTTSHFNVGTLFDGILFTIMGLAILLLQALRGEPVVAPAAATVTVVAAWAALSVFMVWVVAGRVEQVGAGAAGIGTRRRSQLL